MPQNLVAIDLSPKRARIVEIEASLRRSRVSATYSVPLDPEAEPAVRWAQIRAELRRTPETLIVGVDPQAVSTRELRFPFNDMKKVEAALDFELESQIPYDLEDVVTTWTVTHRGGDGVRMLAAIAPRDAVVEALEAMGESQLEPRSVALPAAALAELVGPTNVDPTAVLSLGSQQSHLAVVRDGLRFARTLRTGGIAIDRRLAEHYRVNEDDAREAKEKEARLVLDTSVVSEDVVELSSQVELGLKPLLRELAMTFRALSPEDVPSKILLTGGLSRLAGLDEYLSARLGMDVELVDLGAVAQSIRGEEEGDAEPVVVAPEYATALALGLAQLRRGTQVAMNFRRGELAYSGDFTAYRGEILRIAVGVAAVILIALVGSFIRLSILSAEEDRIDQGFCDASKKIIGREICNPAQVVAILKEPGNTAGGVVIPTYSASDLLDAMSGILMDERDVTFEDLSIEVNGRADEPDTIVGKGETASFEKIEEIVNTLEGRPCIREAEVSRQKRTRDSGRVEFNLEVQIQCPPGVRPGQAVAAKE